MYGRSNIGLCIPFHLRPFDQNWKRFCFLLYASFRGAKGLKGEAEFEVSEYVLPKVDYSRYVNVCSFDNSLIGSESNTILVKCFN